MKNQLNTLAAALAMGVLWAVGIFVWTFVSIKTGMGAKFLDVFTDLYPWYAVTNIGALWGGLWGFIDGFIGTYILIWLYNFFVKKLGK